MIFGLKQYNALQLYQKAALLSDRAVFMMTMIERGMVYSLYFFYGFYVEVLLSDESGKLIDIIGFDQMDKLDKYLDRITLVGF